MHKRKLISKSCSSELKLEKMQIKQEDETLFSVINSAEI